MAEETTKYTDLISKVIQRLAKIWENGEGNLSIEIRNDSNRKYAKIEGGEVERIK